MPHGNLENRERCVVRLKSEEQGAAYQGVGFLISERHVITCAHVVADCIAGVDAKQDIAPEETVKVGFPLVRNREESEADLVSASVVAGGWFPIHAGASKSDIAVLELHGAPPEGTSPARCSNKGRSGADTGFTAYGVPKDTREYGTWTNGEFTGRVGLGFLEIQKQDINDRRWVQPGHSGGAAWSVSHDACVGMVVMEGPKNRALVIPFATLAEAWPPLEALLVEEQERPASVDSSAITYLLDRSPQHNDLLDLMSDCQLNKQPLLVCGIVGSEREAHWALRGRYSVKTLPEALSVEHGIDIRPISWPAGVKGETAKGLMRLKRELKEKLKVKDIDDKTIVAALNRESSPSAFYSTLRSSSFTGDDAVLLKDWVDYWRRLAAGTPPDLPPFTRSISLFLSFEIDVERPEETAMAAVLQQWLAAQDPITFVEMLDSVAFNHAEEWFNEHVLHRYPELSGRRADVILNMQNFFGQQRRPMADFLTHLESLNLNL